jgi:ribonuclease R
MATGEGRTPDKAAARRAILEYLRRPDYRPVPQRELLHRLHIPGGDRPEVRRLLQDLIDEGAVARIRGRRLVAGGAPETVRGLLEMHAEGYGFVIPDGGRPHVFIPRRSVGEAGHRDTVAVRVTGRGKGGKQEGAIVSVLARADRKLLGVFRRRGRGGVVQPFDPSVPQAVLVPASFRHDAADGDAVTLEVMKTRQGARLPEGKVLDVIGRVDAPGVDAMVVARRHGLALRFPREVLDEAGRLPSRVPRREAEQRERFDDPPPVTIDGETAKDFDDAVAVSELARGGFRLFVHIADVAHFVAPDSVLDLEARARGTSVYFPGTVLPMFPEQLSNDLCSLRPGRDRLVQTVVLDLDREGKVRKVRFADGIIRSAARLTYSQVAQVLAGGKRGHGVPGQVVPMLRTMDRLRRALENRRAERGSIDFDLPEPEILLDVEGVMTGVKIEPRNTAHLLIEEFMLAANEAVAGWLEDREIPCVYRVHERPDPAKLETLAEFVAGLGLRLPGKLDAMTPGAIRKLVEKAEGRPDYSVITQVILRSMKQARYTPENIGHFGLAAPVYCHFTSPIRRYPDLVVHRLLRAARAQGKAELKRLATDLDGLAEACSTLERDAEAAERELLAWKAIMFMKDREGEEFDGVVVGVTRFGLFVRLTETLVEGLVHAAGLGNDRFDLVESRQELRGRRTGRSYRLGQPMRVRVVKVDTILRRVDLERVTASGRRATPRAERSTRARPRRTVRRTPRKRGRR